MNITNLGRILQRCHPLSTKSLIAHNVRYGLDHLNSRKQRSNSSVSFQITFDDSMHVTRTPRTQTGSQKS